MKSTKNILVHYPRKLRCTVSYYEKCQKKPIQHVESLSPSAMESRNVLRVYGILFLLAFSRDIRDQSKECGRGTEWGERELLSVLQQVGFGSSKQSSALPAQFHQCKLLPYISQKQRSTAADHRLKIKGDWSPERRILARICTSKWNTLWLSLMLNKRVDKLF